LQQASSCPTANATMAEQIQHQQLAIMKRVHAVAWSKVLLLALLILASVPRPSASCSVIAFRTIQHQLWTSSLDQTESVGWARLTPGRTIKTKIKSICFVSLDLEPIRFEETQFGFFLRLVNNSKKLKCWTSTPRRGLQDRVARYLGRESFLFIYVVRRLFSNFREKPTSRYLAAGKIHVRRTAHMLIIMALPYNNIETIIRPHLSRSNSFDLKRRTCLKKRGTAPPSAHRRDYCCCWLRRSQSWSPSSVKKRSLCSNVQHIWLLTFLLPADSKSWDLANLGHTIHHSSSFWNCVDNVIGPR